MKYVVSVGDDGRSRSSLDGDVVTVDGDVEPSRT